MADTKISALVAAASVDNTEVVPIVQAGTTKKVALSTVKQKFDRGDSTVVTASAAASISDIGRVIVADHATTPIVITINSDVSVGWSANEVLTVWQKGAAGVSFTAGAGVTLRSPSSFPSPEQYGTIAAMRVGANEWTLV